VRFHLSSKRSHRDPVQCSLPYPISPREALFDVVAVDDIDENGFIVAKMTTVTDERTKNLSECFDFAGVTSGFERCDFDGAVLFRACPTNHPNYNNAKQTYSAEKEELILSTFAFHFDARLQYIPQGLINFVTREVMGVVWSMLLNVVKQVGDGTRQQHCTVIAEKRELYAWVEQRCQFMLEQIRTASNDKQRTENVIAPPASNENTPSRKSDRDWEEKKDEAWSMEDILQLNT
jgi:hypothetical protein